MFAARYELNILYTVHNLAYVPKQRKRYSNLRQAGRSGDRIPVGRRDFHLSRPALGNTLEIGSIPGVKLPGRGVDHPAPSSAKVKERVELYLHSSSELSWPILGRTLPIYNSV